MSFWQSALDRALELRDYAIDAINEARNRLAEFIAASSESEGEPEIFDEEPSGDNTPLGEAEADLQEAESDLADAENEIADIEADIPDVENDIADIEAEPDRNEINFPDWISQDDIDRIINETGSTDWNDIWDSERDEFLPGWRGFEDADEAAGEMDEFRDEIQNILNIPDDVMSQLSDDELLTLSILSDGSGIGLAREFEEMTPEEAAEENNAEYVGTFTDWQSLINSELWNAIMDRPDIFEIYINEDGSIEVYESEDTN